MMKLQLLLVILIFSQFSSYTYAAGGDFLRLNFRLKANAGYLATSFNVDDGRKANFAGYAYGGEFEAKAAAGSYSLAAYIGYYQSNENNTANTSSQKESFTSKQYLLGGRLYAIDAFVGGAVVTLEERLNSLVNEQRNQKYSGFGGRFELGMDFWISNSLYITPTGFYLIGNVKQDGASTAPRRVDILGGFVGLGFAF